MPIIRWEIIHIIVQKELQRYKMVKLGNVCLLKKYSQGNVSNYFSCWDWVAPLKSFWIKIKLSMKLESLVKLPLPNFKSVT